jgi:hypothetical protein
MDVYVGIDWGCGSHAVCVIDVKGSVLDRFDAGHDRDGLAGLVARLKRHGSPSKIPVAIERPTGLLVDHLVEVGLKVVPIHPNAVKACRPRYRAVSAKSDPGDAYILADVLRDLWSSASPASAPIGRHPCFASPGAGPRRLGRHPGGTWPLSSPRFLRASGPAA